MQQTFLVFLKQGTSGEEFVAPVTATTRAAAELAARQKYPAATYQLLTVYGFDEMARILDDTRRWPGLVTPAQASTAATARPLEQAQADALATLMARKAAPESAQAQPMHLEKAMGQESAVDIMRRLAQARQGVAATRAVPPAPAAGVDTANQPVTRTPAPQDLKSVLALLKAAPASGRANATTTGALGGGIQQSQDAPLTRQPTAASATGEAISRRPAQAEAAAAMPKKTSVVDVFRMMRK